MKSEDICNNKATLAPEGELPYDPNKVKLVIGGKEYPCAPVKKEDIYFTEITTNKEINLVVEQVKPNLYKHTINTRSVLLEFYCTKSYYKVFKESDNPNLVINDIEVNKLSFEEMKEQY